jgi:translation initiation factor 3 subunit L
MSNFQNTAQTRAMDNDSDVEEEVLVAEYKEQQEQYDDGMDDMDQGSVGMAQQPDDIQARLAAAAQPLEFSATLDVKFQSYDAYCSLFHFILNSDGPIDLEPPSVSAAPPMGETADARSSG